MTSTRIMDAATPKNCGKPTAASRGMRAAARRSGSVRVGVVTAAVEIARPPHEVFAFVADRRNRARMLPDNFTDFRLLTDNPTGAGARFRFTIHTDRGEYGSETELIAFEPPVSFTERTTDDESTYETGWWFGPRDGGTLVRTELRYETPRGLINRLLGRFARKALGQSLLVELLRLRTLMEEA